MARLAVRSATCTCAITVYRVYNVACALRLIDSVWVTLDLGRVQFSHGCLLHEGAPRHLQAGSIVREQASSLNVHRHLGVLVLHALQAGGHRGTQQKCY
jgi:hypothetical protein